MKLVVPLLRIFKPGLTSYRLSIWNNERRVLTASMYTGSRARNSPTLRTPPHLTLETAKPGQKVPGSFRLQLVTRYARKFRGGFISVHMSVLIPEHPHKIVFV